MLVNAWATCMDLSHSGIVSTKTQKANGAQDRDGRSWEYELSAKQSVSRFDARPEGPTPGLYAFTVVLSLHLQLRKAYSRTKDSEPAERPCNRVLLRVSR